MIIPQAIATQTPICGKYVYRSAMAWLPTCTNPITGTSVPRYHSHPKTR